MITRRRLLAAAAIGLTGRELALNRWSTEAGAENTLSSDLTPHVHEITMAAPDIVCIEFRDAPFQSGTIRPLLPPAARSVPGDWVARDGEWGRVLGVARAHMRTADRPPVRRVDPAWIDGLKGASLGDRAVVSVHRKSVPYDSGLFRAEDGATVRGVAMKHYAYLRLAEKVPPGRHAITGSGQTLNTIVDFDDKTTRAISIRCNQHGHRPDDPEKSAYLALWLPQGDEDGAFRFEPYELKSFNVIDGDGIIVFTGPIELRLGPKMLEKSESALLTYEYADGRTYQANRSGTYVYGLDYSTWTGGRAGEYRLQIPGLGVSDPFEVSAAAWYKAARASLSGLYHHRSGIRLDGRYGYERPAAHRPGTTGDVYDSKLPFLFSSENPLGFVPFGQGAARPWVTEAANPQAWGGYMDAGDWDRNTVHLNVANGLLLIHDVLPAEVRNVSWGLPKSSSILDAELYAEIDGLPDLVHESAFALDLYRRMQDPRTGAVRGGIEASSTPLHGEPSYLDSTTVFTYAPDHQSSWRYAASAARFARILLEGGKPNLARVYQRSAVQAFEWAEAAHTQLDGIYAEAIGLATQSGLFRDKSWADRKMEIAKETKPARASAAAALYRLSREIRYKQLYETLHESGLTDQGEGGDARWDYARAAGRDHKFDGTAILDQFATTARRYILSGQGAGTNYRSTKWSGIPMWWGQGNAPDYNQVQMLLRAHHHTKAPLFLKCLQAAAAHVLGANQAGICMTTGLGRRSVRHPLHEDHMALGTPVPSGITVYGYGSWQLTDYAWIWGDNSWSVLPPEPTSARRRQERIKAWRPTVHPYRKSLPLYEYFIEHPLMIMQQEYTIHQTICPLSMALLYLNGHDGNSAGVTR